MWGVRKVTGGASRDAVVGIGGGWTWRECRKRQRRGQKGMEEKIEGGEVKEDSRDGATVASTK